MPATIFKERLSSIDVSLVFFFVPVYMNNIFFGLMQHMITTKQRVNLRKQAVLTATEYMFVYILAKLMSNKVNYLRILQ